MSLELMVWFFVYFNTASPQQGDLRLSGPPSCQGAGSGAPNRDRKVPADLREDSLATVPRTPPRVDGGAKTPIMKFFLFYLL
ncbi:hypothetical protein PoB_004411000 [Plakobranchus ocellatus]|uniref:Uncharacterized protein n=1 Tax=Plakobranchus ocellatus TaxID=259542 RepID=A0AAV4BAH7_9GAST|nr:hypothetical protein PoB_004411000 [Plakobranchus ocellatus]